jgi:hypothetical protein
MSLFNIDFKADVHIHFHPDPRVDELLTLTRQIMAALAALQAEVAEDISVTQSAITLLNGLSAKIEELKNDPVALQQLADDLKANRQSLADAVSQNTPAE